MLSMVNQIKDELRGAWRYRWTALAVAWAVSLVGWFMVCSRPESYEAWARVYVDTRTPLRPLLAGVAAEQDVESQIVMVRQALLGKQNLERVAAEADLVSAVATAQQRQGVIGGLAQRVKIDLEPLVGRDLRTPNTFYKITYQDSTRDKSARVVELLLKGFVEDTFGTKRDSAETAEAFLVDQLKQYRQRLTAGENALAEFKRDNIGMVPGEGGGYFQRLDQEQGNVQRVEAALRVALRRRGELEKQLRGEAPFVPSAQTGGAAGAGASQGPADTASRTQETQARLDELLLRFTDKHPDVIAARQTLDDLKARQAQELAAVRGGDPAAAALAGAPTNPVYQSIRVQLHEADVQIAALRGELNDYQRNVAMLRQALDTAPDVEAEYIRLTRDYEVTQAQYNALLQRLEQARVSEDAQQTGIVDFQIIDPPTASYAPVFPTRPVLLVLVLMISGGLGAGTAWLLSKFRPVFHHGRALADFSGLPVIGVISLAWLDRHHAALKRDYLKYAAAASLLVAMTAVVMGLHEAGSRLVRALMS
ncbi:MAG: XrtA system polysaccharide chain length determinant [Steroidobacteraceae bacterium]